MELNDFIANFAEQFDETDPQEIQAETAFHDLEEWGSLVAMATMAMVKTQYGKTVTGADLRQCVTVKDLFDLVNAK